MNDTTTLASRRPHLVSVRPEPREFLGRESPPDSSPRGAAILIHLDAGIDRELSSLLRQEGYRVIRADDDRACMRLVGMRAPAVVFCGSASPAAVPLCSEIRKWSGVPVVFVTDDRDEAPAIAAFDAGADDVVRLPVRVAEFLARIRALRRRAAESRAAGPRGAWFGDVEIDLARSLVTRGGDWVRLSRTEWSLLAELARNANDVVSATDLLRAVWGDAATGNRHYLHVYVARLRAKLEPDPGHPAYLVAEHGTGYRLRATPTP